MKDRHDYQTDCISLLYFPFYWTFSKSILWFGIDSSHWEFYFSELLPHNTQFGCVHLFSYFLNVHFLYGWFHYKYQNNTPLYQTSHNTQRSNKLLEVHLKKLVELGSGLWKHMNLVASIHLACEWTLHHIWKIQIWSQNNKMKRKQESNVCTSQGHGCKFGVGCIVCRFKCRDKSNDERNGQ